MRSGNIKSREILVVGTRREEDLVESLSRVGFSPTVRNTLREALERLRHEAFAAVLLDRDRGEMDALEFVLNVRDFTTQIPIFIVGQAEDSSAILSQPRTLLLADSDTPEDLARRIQTMFPFSR